MSGLFSFYIIKYIKIQKYSNKNLVDSIIFCNFAAELQIYDNIII